MSAPVDEITAEEASKRLDQYCIIDVREPAEYSGELGHIAGSQLLPLGVLDAHLGSGATRADLFKGHADRPLLMVCRSGGRSGKACERLAQAGIGGAINMLGGMLEWNRVGLPVVRAGAAPGGGKRG
jgi:rhodanese-related sulfurtransferase